MNVVGSALIAGWLLWYGNGKVLPKHCPPGVACAATMAAWAVYGGTYKTKAECERAGRKAVANFAEVAQANDEYVFLPLETHCTWGWGDGRRGWGDAEGETERKDRN
jgi:hypothetical protein